jgi:predicted RNA-binding protein YlqC (UPF0109 family)
VIISDLIIAIAKALVDDTESVTVECIATDNGTLLRLGAASGDVGKVIGSDGRMARSLRTVLMAISMNAKHRYTLDIKE